MILPGNEQKFLKCNPGSIKELKDRTVQKEGSALTSLTDRNVEKFRANNNPSADVNDSTIMIKTTFGCMGCHQN